MFQPVSVIISFYNKIDLLKLIFAALEIQTYRNFEVIIADDGSKPEVVDEIMHIRSNYFFPVKHVWHEDKGWQKDIILNKAVMATESDYLIFIDGDCIPEKHLIQEHIENRAVNQIVSGRRVMLTEKISNKLSVQKVQNGYLNFAVAFPLFFETVFGGKHTYMENMLRIRNKFLRRLFLKDRRRYLLGCNYSVWKSDVLKVNGFDERFVYPGMGEDTDFEGRLSRIGVFPVSKKHLVTIFHFYHIQFDTDHEPNKKLYEENNRKKITFTPYGIQKTNQVS
jgi:glycosyltransferase involved in cell wall biosynthesis